MIGRSEVYDAFSPDGTKWVSGLWGKVQALELRPHTPMETLYWLRQGDF
jgi:hypothetical protein